MQALLCIGHGSRVKHANRQAFDFMEKCTEGIEVPIREYCFLELSEPSIEEGIAACVQRGATHIAVLPALLLAAGHVKKDIPAKIRAAKRHYPGISFSYGQPFGVHEAIVSILIERMQEQAEVAEDASVLLVGRGSSDPEVKGNFGSIRECLLHKHVFQSVETAYLAAARPSFQEGLEKALSARNSQVFVVPYLLFNGMLMNEMRESVDLFNKRERKFVLCDPLGYHRHLKIVVRQRVEEVLDSLAVRS